MSFPAPPPNMANAVPLPSDFVMPPPLTPEQFAALPHDNKGPRLLVTIWTLAAIATSFLLLRLYCKWLRHRGLWWDDWILIGAWACITAESGLLTHDVSLGYGLHIWDLSPDPAIINETLTIINAAGALSLTAAVWSKTSFALTLLRLSGGSLWMRWVLWLIIISMNVAMGLSALFIYIHCMPVEKAWNIWVEGTCWPVEVQVKYNIFSAAYSAACDIALALLPWKLIWGLQMKKNEKIGVAVAMSCGLFAGITAIIKTTKIPSMASIDPSDGVDLFIWGNAESCVTIIAASIPILRVLVREFSASARRKYTGATERPLNPGTTAASAAARKSQIITLNNIVTVSAGPPMMKIDLDKEDGGSERSSTAELMSPMGGIMRTKEVEVEYFDVEKGRAL